MGQQTGRRSGGPPVRLIAFGAKEKYQAPLAGLTLYSPAGVDRPEVSAPAYRPVLLDGEALLIVARDGEEGALHELPVIVGKGLLGGLQRSHQVRFSPRAL